MPESVLPKLTVATTPEYTLVVRPEGDGLPGVIRLRGLLKEALRKYGLRCVRCSEATATPTTRNDTPDLDCQN